MPAIDIVAAVRDRRYSVLRVTGARIEAVAVDGALIAAADAILERGDDGRFLLMELEVIEPSLYLRMHDEAPARFAAAFDTYVKRH